MKDLSLYSKLYIVGTVLAGGFIFYTNLASMKMDRVWVTILLACLASLALILKVEGTTKRSHYNISFLVYSATFFLLGAPEAIIVIVVSNLIEWILHKYPWYIQSFNIGCYLITLEITNLTYTWINPEHTLSSWQGIFSSLIAMLVFTLVNHLLVGIILWLARGENFKKSGIFDLITLIIDFTLLSMGTGVALVWTFEPVAIIFILIPLYLIYNTLRVPALERQTEIDVKTGVYNHKYFEKTLEEELLRANRFDLPLTVVMADLDLLRNINNTYGHLAGDEVLIGVANILKNHMRAYDTVARFGGEEFSILLHETTAEHAFEIVEAIRKDIENTEFNIPTSVSPIRVTMSFGIASRDGANLTAKELLHNADTAVYHSKLRGRNRTFVFNDQIYPGLFPVSPMANTYISTQASVQGSLNNNPTIADSSSPADNHSIIPENTPNLIATPKPEWMIKLFILAVLTVSISSFGILYQPFELTDISSLLIFSLMVFCAEWFSQDIYIRNTAVSTSAAPILAGTLLLGPVGALTLSFIFALTAFVKHKSPLSRLFFNFSNQLLASMLCLLLISLIRTDLSVENHAIQLLIYLFLSMVIYFSTTNMVTTAMHLSTGAPFKHIWREHFSWLAPYYLVLGMIAYALSFSYLHAGLIGAMVIAVPLMLLHFSQKQYINRTKEIVKELKEKTVVLKNNSDEINRLNEGLLKTLAEVVDLRDPFVLGHSQQVSRYSVMIAQKMGLDPAMIERIRQASLLHDLGKLGIPEQILLKPSRLTQKEYEIVKEHSVLGAEILRSSPSLASLMPIVRHHHEHYDGNGYPDGLVGEDIPIEARIIAVADAIEAMASDRPYRQAIDLENILKELNSHSGTQFDPEIVATFSQIALEEGASLVINSAREGLKSRLISGLDTIYSNVLSQKDEIPGESDRDNGDNIQTRVNTTQPLQFICLTLPN